MNGLCYTLLFKEVVKATYVAHLHIYHTTTTKFIVKYYVFMRDMLIRSLYASNTVDISWAYWKLAILHWKDEGVTKDFVFMSCDCWPCGFQLECIRSYPLCFFKRYIIHTAYKDRIKKWDIIICLTSNSSTQRFLGRFKP